jgi:hypothetical protein
MRKIEQDMVKAIKARKNWQSGNTRVQKSGSFIDVYLHNNHIARVAGKARPNARTFRNWPTVTTASRLRALGIHATIKNGMAHIDGQPV